MHKATILSTTQDGTRPPFPGKISIWGGRSRSTTRPGTSNGSTERSISYEDSVDPLETFAFDLAAEPRRKTSFSVDPGSPKGRGRKPSVDTVSYIHPQERRPSTTRGRLQPPILLKIPDHHDSTTQQSKRANLVVRESTTAYSNMLASSLTRDFKTSNQYVGSGFNTGIASVGGPSSPVLENITYQHIQEMAAKRIQTLDYLRKAHEGRIYWFNTFQFNKPDLARMPYFDTRRLARRATNYLLLGLSLPTILDLNSSTPMDFLRTLNALLAEFEAFQQIHPPDGSTSSSLSRARLPQMFKRATTNSGGKGRRTSSAADIGLPMGHEPNDLKSVAGSISSASSNATSFPSSDSDLLPGEEYTYLLTPSLPFDPDFYETFATLCDVLIDCYTRLTSLIATPKECGPHIAEMFTKADARIRKIIVQGVVKEFEDSSRSGVKSEVSGVGKVVLGGLM